MCILPKRGKVSKGHFYVAIPPDVTAAPNEAPRRSLISGHNRKNATNCVLYNLQSATISSGATGLVVHPVFPVLLSVPFLLLPYL